jgi:formylmethanofuran dehydrogenase subunit E
LSKTTEEKDMDRSNAIVNPGKEREVRREELPEPLQRAKAFHGHLGPNVTLGLRMGRLIVDRFGGEPFSFRITSFTGWTPPVSCIIDGLQLSTPCTVGNGYLRIVEEGVLRAIARKEGREIDIRVRPEIAERVKTEFDRNHEEVLPLALWTMNDRELFEVEER